MEETINERRLAHAFRNFRRVLEAYGFREPLARFLTRFYKENRQMGASDRRTATRLCYNYFRSGNVATETDLLEKLTVSEFLCETESAFVARYKPQWNAKMGLSVREKTDFLEKEGISVRDRLFPFTDQLSPSIDRDAFVRSLLVQPDLFIRARRAKNGRVERELSKNGIPFGKIEPNGYRLPNGTRLQDLKEIAGDFEVQDLSSQRIGGFINASPGEKWWDACAGSGGKALLLLDACPDIDLWVSDVRPGMLHNLHVRFRRAGLRMPYHAKLLDLATGRIPNAMEKASFDGILLDAPCSGSGTWARTPEMMQPFSRAKLSGFSERQRKMAANLLPYLKPGGVLVYVTCSVFGAENEQIVQFLETEHGLRVEKTETIKGYGERADTMFAGRLRMEG